ncbi:MAG TPA: hypothetical protein VLV15_11630 [Dongiaceae bacterium]|nr:hypothetical protein [Dongiaceae bacterium]
MSTHMRSVILAGGALLCGPAAAFAQSCAMCGSSFSPNDPATRAFTWSIIFLLLVPYTIFGLAAGFVFWSFRRAGDRPRATIIPMSWRRRPTAPVDGPEEA